MSDEGSGYPGAPPGWYPDPAGGPGQRWWDGYEWTETTTVPPTPAPPRPPNPYPSLPPTPPWAASGSGYGYGANPYMAPPAAGNAQVLVADEARISALGRTSLTFAGAGALINVIFMVANASQYRTFGHEFRLSVEAAQNHQVAPVVVYPDSLNTFTTIVGLLGLVAFIVRCIWQYRAAAAARALHFPAKRSPGWGVAFLFIPIVNLWMPYQALRDCLPGSDPNRAVVLHYWLYSIATEIGTVACVVALSISTPVGVFFAILTGFCALGVLATAPHVVTSIATAHQAALNP